MVRWKVLWLDAVDNARHASRARLVIVALIVLAMLAVGFVSLVP